MTARFEPFAVVERAWRAFGRRVLAPSSVGWMNVDAVKTYCAAFAGASSTLYGPPSNILVFYAGGRKFAYFKTSEPERWRFSIRTSPERFLELTDVPGIKPARYLARFHWVTIVTVDAVPADYLRELIDGSYRMAVTPTRRKAPVGRSLRTAAAR